MPPEPDAVAVKPLTVFDLFFSSCRHDSLIAIGSRRPSRKNPEPFPHWHTALTVEDRREMLPMIFEHQIEHSQYMLQNTLKQAALVKPLAEYEQAIRDGKPKYYAVKNRHVAELVAHGVDLDVGRPDSERPEERITAGQALGHVFDGCLEDKLPWPSLAALSGRGLYLFWFLVDRNGSPPLNTKDNLEDWRQVQRELIRRTDWLASDAQASNEARWFKRPGTIDTNTGREVVYLTFGIKHPGRVPRYRLADLKDRLGVYRAPIDVEPKPPTEPPAALDAPKANERKRNPSKGGASRGAAHAKRADEIQRLNSYRGGFTEGCRHTAARHFFFSRRAYLTIRYRDAADSEAARKALQHAWHQLVGLNQTFRPPLHDQELTKAARSFTSTDGRLPVYRPRNDRLAAELHTTQAETKAISLQMLAHHAIRDAATQAKRANTKRLADEREAIDAAIRAGEKTANIARRLGILYQKVHYRRKLLARRGQLRHPLLEPTPAS